MDNSGQDPCDRPAHVTWKRVDEFRPLDSGESSYWRRSLERLRERFAESAKTGNRIVAVLRHEAIPIFPPSPDGPLRPPETNGLTLLMKFGVLSHADCFILGSADGIPLVADEPVLDRTGKPILLPDGRPAAIRRGYFRKCEYWVNRAPDDQLDGIPLAGFDVEDSYFGAASAASEVIRGLPIDVRRFLWSESLDGFRPGDDEALWTLALFALAWKRLPGTSLRAPRYTWTGNSRCELEAFPAFIKWRQAEATRPGMGDYPANPLAWYSVIDDMLTASVNAIDILLAHPAAGSQGPMSPVAVGNVRASSASDGRGPESSVNRSSLEPVPLREIVTELRDFKSHATFSMDEASAELVADYLSRFYWQQVRQHVKRLRALMPADVDLADCGPWIRGQLETLQQILEDLWSTHHLDDVERERSFALAENEQSLIDWILAKFPPADDPRLAAEPVERVNRIFGTGTVTSVDAYFQTIRSPAPAPGAKRDEPAPAAEGDDPPAKLKSEDDRAEFVFAPDGDGYYIRGFDESGRLSAKGCKGLHQLFKIIQTPGVAVPMTNLMGAGEKMGRDVGRLRDKAKRAEVDAVHSGSSWQPTVTDEERKSIEADLRRTRAELEKAEAAGDTVEVEHCRQHINSVEAKRRSMLGMSGKARNINSEANRLRPSITPRLKAAYEKMREAKPPMTRLADHFEFSISAEGGGFIYRPAGDPPPWSLNRTGEK